MYTLSVHLSNEKRPRSVCFPMVLSSSALSNLVWKNWYSIAHHLLLKPGTLVPWIQEPSSPFCCRDSQDSPKWKLQEAFTELLSATHAPTGNPKTMPLEPTWGIEAVSVVLGGVGCEDIHPCVVGCTDGIGGDPRDHHMAFYEPIPAKEKQEVINRHGQDSVHNIPSNDI